MQVWSYKITSLPFDENEKNSTIHLNEMGAEGWELVSVGVQAGSNSSRFYWKKYNLNDAERSTEQISDVDKISETYGKESQTSEASTERSSLKKPPKIDLQIGDMFPEFQLPSTDGEYFRTNQLDQKTVIYFYPADGTELCSIQAKGFSAVYETITELGLDVIGISPDDIEAHNKFKSDEKIPFQLLYDKDSKVCAELGLLQREPPLELYPLRVTFLVDTDRTILGLWNDEDVDVSSHSDDVVSFVLEVIEKAN